MTNPAQPRISLRDPGDLIASVPPLLGFRPAESLVLAVFSGSPEARLRLTVRADLPPPDLHLELANQLVTPLLQVESCAVVVIVVGGGLSDPPWALPRRDLVAVVEKVCHGVGIQVIHSLWTASVEAGASWRCYDESYCAGEVSDPATTAVAAAADAAGVSTFDSREDMAATVSPDDADALARRAAMLEKVAADEESCPGQVKARGCGLLDELIGGGFDSMTGLDDDQVVDLAVALCDVKVRDGCLGTAFTERAGEAERLWAELTRRVPPPHRAEPACLLAFFAYARGDGAMTGMALDRALEADPGHRLALLLRCALDTGFPPGEVRTMLARLTEEQREEVSTTGTG